MPIKVLIFLEFRIAFFKAHLSLFETQSYTDSFQPRFILMIEASPGFKVFSFVLTEFST